MNTENQNRSQEASPTGELVGVDVPRLVRLTWRKQQAQWGPLTYRLRRGGKEDLAVVQRDKEGTWYWYGGGRNTWANPTDLETAKKDAKAHILSLANTKFSHDGSSASGIASNDCSGPGNE